MQESCLIKLQVSMLQLYWNKELSHRFSLMNCAVYLRHHIYRTPPGDCFCYMENHSDNNIVKNPLRKKKWKQQLKLHHFLHQVFISFYYFKISLFLFSLLPVIYWKHEFLETMQDLSTIENYFSPSVRKKWICKLWDT